MRRAFLLPVAFLTYSLAYLDRANYGFGAAAGLAKTLHITEGRSALLGALFFLGYFAFQVPGMLVARRFSSTRLVFVCLIAWGVLASLTGVIRSFAWLAVDRLLLGIAESAIFPAMLLLLTRWFTRAERSRANTVLMLGNPVTVLWMSAITGFLVERMGWQSTFIVEGLPAIVWAFVWIAVVRDEPSQAKWMDRTEARQLEVEILRQHLAVNEHVTEAVTLRDVLLQRDVLLLCAQYFWWSLGVYGFVLWLPLIVHLGAAVSMASTGLLSAIPYAVAAVFMLAVAQGSDRTLKRKEFVWPFLLLAGVAMFGSFTFAGRSFPLAFACLVLAGASMYAPYGPFFALIPERVPRAFTGEAFALINSAGALGAFAGSYIVGLLHAVTGNAKAGDLLMAASLAFSAVLLWFLPGVRAQDRVVELKHG